jgi:hypothetical protein
MSSATLYFENNLASVSSHPAGYVQLTYHAGECALQDLQVVLQHTGDLLQRRRWFRLLEDQHQLVPLTVEGQEVLGHPLCVAVVLAKNVFTRLAAATLRHDLQAADIRYRLFHDAPTADSWLQTQMRGLRSN